MKKCPGAARRRRGSAPGSRGFATKARPADATLAAIRLTAIQRRREEEAVNPTQHLGRQQPFGTEIEGVKTTQTLTTPASRKVAPPLAQVFSAFLRLGVTSFGGPIAHLGYFNAEFVRGRKWLDEDTFAQVVALCQFLPGPASSQVAMIIGLIRAGLPGAALAWLAFTLPSAIAMVAFAFGITRVAGAQTAPWIHGLLIAAVAVVAVAVANMYRSLCPDVPRKAVALAAAAVMLSVPASGFVQLELIAAGAVFGRLFIRSMERKTTQIPVAGRRTSATLCGIAFITLLIGLPVCTALRRLRSAQGIRSVL
jgi:chromate transport protein ChrA